MIFYNNRNFIIYIYLFRKFVGLLISHTIKYDYFLSDIVIIEMFRSHNTHNFPIFEHLI